jgi:hypothetical protein
MESGAALPAERDECLICRQKWRRTRALFSDHRSLQALLKKGFESVFPTFNMTVFYSMPC